MDAAAEPTDARRIAALWLPMAATWFMMAAEGPFLTAIVARLAEPEINLAAHGVAYAFALLVEAPVIMMLSASTALVEDRGSLRRLAAFSNGLNAALTVVQVALVATPAFTWVAERLLDLPPEVAWRTRLALALLIPWPGAIGYRRFWQGLLIRDGRTRLVAYGTVVRIATMAATAAALYRMDVRPGACVGAAALSAGVCAEAVAARWMARGVVRRLGEGSGAALDLGTIGRFYLPLALTSVLTLASQPVVTFFMGHAPRPVESLAVLPVVIALVFLFRSPGFAYQEVAIAVLARNRGSRGAVRRFAVGLAVVTSAALAVLAFTPLARLWFEGVAGLAPELARAAIVPARVLVLLPASAVILSLQRAELVDARRTGPVTWATVVELVGIVLALVAGIAGLGLPGAEAAAWAFLVGRLAGNVWLGLR